MKVTYSGIDIAKFICALLIPFLHINFESTTGILLFRECFSRLGVPIFIASSGFFLSMSINKKGGTEALLHFIKRIGLMLLAWLIIYSPFFIKMFIDNPLSALQQLLFKTPAFLWYLTAMLFASIPFCLISNRRILWLLSGILYLIGVLFGQSYSWLTNGLPVYDKIFLTTRNGLFFALPIMCAGEILSAKKDVLKHKYIKLLVSLIFYYAEVLFVLVHTDLNTDRSMYLMLPFVTFYLMSLLLDVKTNIDTRNLRQLSSAIYVVQYGVIVVINKFFDIINFSSALTGWIIYVAVIFSGILLQMIVKRFPKLKFII